MTDLSPFRNRLQKNFRHWSKWAKRRGISCYRIYDRDIPEFPLAIDWYEGAALVQAYSPPWERDPEQVEAMEDAIAESIRETLAIPPERLHFKTRQRQKGLSQYEKTGEQGNTFVVHEAGLKFRVNLDDYLDTGLFLDHRQTRQMVREKAAGRRFLNLFAYTGSFTVYAASGGASESTTVDLSNTYQQWSQENFRLNELDLKRHRLVAADVFRYLEQATRNGERFDLIVMDPPSFSNSKKMRETLDIQRDHPQLVRQCLKLLSTDGELIFSNNFRRFRLDDRLQEESHIEEISHKSVPEDFRRHRPHRCWSIRRHG